MANHEKSPLRKAAPVATDETPDATVDVDGEAEASAAGPAQAVHELRDSVSRAWSEARSSVSGLGVKLGRRARNVGEETRAAAADTRESFDAAVGEMGELGEEIAIKGTTAQTRPQIRKCVGALWDALTTVKHLLEHYNEPTNEEQEILINRLQATLRAFGGAREKVGDDEIEALMKSLKG